MQKTPFTLLLQEKTKVFSKQRQLFTKKLGAVIGFGLYRFEYQRDQEIDIFRRRMVNIRKQEQEAATASCNNNLHPYLDQAPLTDYLMEILGSINYRLHIRIHLPHNSQIVKTFVCKCKIVCVSVCYNMYTYR